MTHHPETARRWTLQAGIDVPLDRFRELIPEDLEATIIWAVCEVRIAEGSKRFRCQPMPRWLQAYAEPPKLFAGIRLARVPVNAPPPPVPDGELEPFCLPAPSIRGSAAHWRFDL